MNWLLPAQTLLDLLASTPNAATQWAATVDVRSLRTSVIAVAEANATIENATISPATRKRLAADLSALLSQIQADSGIGPLDFTQAHANFWVALYSEPSIANVTLTERQVYATAMYEGLSVVESSRPETAALRTLGILIHDL
jgi:hypothetical protein